MRLTRACELARYMHSTSFASLFEHWWTMSLFRKQSARVCFTVTLHFSACRLFLADSFSGRACRALSSITGLAQHFVFTTSTYNVQRSAGGSTKWAVGSNQHTRRAPSTSRLQCLLFGTCLNRLLPPPASVDPPRRASAWSFLHSTWTSSAVVRGSGGT